MDARATLLAERPSKALTVDAVVETAGVAKGTFYYHFQSIDELAAAVGATLGESFDELLTPAQARTRDPIEHLSFAFTQFLERAGTTSSGRASSYRARNLPPSYGQRVRANLKADIAEAIAEGRVEHADVELAADIVMGIWLQVARGILKRGARPELTSQALEAVLRALGLCQR